tara:strand:+ start:26857 stop:27213 length:357 start_codon:yes stop_codon:yes gene_type:complete
MITVNVKAETLKEGIMNMTNAMVEDYTKNFGASDNNEVREKMCKEYATGFSIKTGKKFIKVVNNGGVKAFISMIDFGRFKMGDILKPAGWQAPALNQARGNVLSGNYAINWTGPLYLK